MIYYKVREMKKPGTGESIYFPVIARTFTLTYNDVVNAINKMCTLSSPDIRAALSALEYSVGTYLTQGRSVIIEGLGTFRPTLEVFKSEETAKKVTARNIKALRCRFSAAPELKNALDRSKLNLRKVKD